MEGHVVYVTDVPTSHDAAPFDSVPDVLTRQGIAQILNVNVRTVSREIARGRLGCFRVGRSVRVTKEQLLTYIEEATAND